MTQLALNNAGKGADFSDCGRYRYRLWRWWGGSDPLVTWVMLNPSTADEDQDDPTIRRCMGFARAWGYGGIMVLNIFALRSTDPRGLREVDDPVGPDWDAWCLPEIRGGGLAIAAWGVHGHYQGRGEIVRHLYRAEGSPLHHMGLTKAGFPKHPLYLRGDTKPTPWEVA